MELCSNCKLAGVCELMKDQQEEQEVFNAAMAELKNDINAIPEQIERKQEELNRQHDLFLDSQMAFAAVSDCPNTDSF